MEAILHIENISRKTTPPLNIGHTEHISYGEIINEEGDYSGPISYIGLGYPLEEIDYGSQKTSLPLVKTIGYLPDQSRPKGHVYTETLYYFKDRKFLIPYRTKICSGPKMGVRVNHLPSLNFIRETISGTKLKAVDAKAEIVGDLLLQHHLFSEKDNRSLRDWINEELCFKMSRSPLNELSFDSENIVKFTNNFVNRVKGTSCELSYRDIKDLNSLTIPCYDFVSSRYREMEPLVYPLVESKLRLVNSPIDFKSYGPLKLNHLNCIDYNPFGFQDICDLIDTIPLTDFNVDFVLTPDNDILVYNEHLALNRFGIFEDNDLGVYHPKTILTEILNGQILSNIFDRFFFYHNSLDEQVKETLCDYAIKIKIIKTMTDEVAILLYRYNSNENETPLCGVYFDMALQSLAPISIIPETLQN